MVDLFGRPTPRVEPFELSGLRASDANDRIQFRFSLRLEQQRYGNYGQGSAVAPPGLNLGAPELPNAGMQKCFELLAGAGIGKNFPGEDGPPKTALCVSNFMAEQPLDFNQRRLARLNNLPGEVVSVDYANSTALEEPGTGRFAHADTASEPDGFHPVKVIAGPRDRIGSGCLAKPDRRR